MMRYDQMLCLAMLMSGAMLTGCGGGGGGSPAPTPTPSGTTPTPTPSPSSSALQTEASFDYASSSVEFAALTQLNARRKACGFGVLNQSKALDQAAQLHAKYLLTEGINNGHSESNTSSPFFRGKTTQARVASANYVGPLVSAQIFSATNVKRGDPVLGVGYRDDYAMKSLLVAPYHLAGMMTGAREIGLAYLESSDVSLSPAQPQAVLKALFGLPTGSSLQQILPAQVISYPCQGSTDTHTTLFAEAPVPIPARDALNQQAGQPVLLHAPEQHVLTVSSFSITEQSSGVQVDAVQLTSAQPQHNPTNLPIAEANRATVQINDVLLLPLTPLKPNTTYRVQASGTHQNSQSGAAAQSFSLDFSFSTGESNAF